MRTPGLVWLLEGEENSGCGRLREPVLWGRFWRRFAETGTVSGDSETSDSDSTICCSWEPYQDRESYSGGGGGALHCAWGGGAVGCCCLEVVSLAETVGGCPTTGGAEACCGATKGCCDAAEGCG